MMSMGDDADAMGGGAWWLGGAEADLGAMTEEEQIAHAIQMSMAESAASDSNIEQISAEQSDKHHEVIEAQDWIHPLIPVDALKKKYGIDRIVFPPPSANNVAIPELNKSYLVVVGEKE